MSADAVVTLERRPEDPTYAEKRREVVEKIRTAQAHPAAVGFHCLFYSNSDITWNSCSWLGRPLAKNPLDLWVYQEIISSLQPTVIIETGSWYGGSGLYYASLCQLIGRGHVLSIDVNALPSPMPHPRLTFHQGSSVAPETLDVVRKFVKKHAHGGHVFVSLDSDHSPEHVAQELALYTPFVTVGSYCVVEDMDCSNGTDNRRPILNEYWAPRGGPSVAVFPWLEAHPEWEADPMAEHYIFTSHPDGWLKRLR